MTLIAVGSCRGAPGATNATLLFAQQAAAEDVGAPAVALECDPDGGVIASRYGLPVEPGLASLAAEARRADADVDLWRHVQTLPGPVPVVVAPPAGDHCRAALAFGEAIAHPLAAFEGTVFADCGRITPQAPAWPIVARADRVVLVARPRVDELAPLAAKIASLRGADVEPCILLVGSEPYDAEEVRSVLDAAVIGSLPSDFATQVTVPGTSGVRPARRRRRQGPCADLLASLHAERPAGDAEVGADPDLDSDLDSDLGSELEAELETDLGTKRPRPSGSRVTLRLALPAAPPATTPGLSPLEPWDEARAGTGIS